MARGLNPRRRLALAFALLVAWAPLSMARCAAQMAQDQAPPGSGALRRLAGNIQGFRLAGEIASSEWPLYVTSAQAEEQLRFRIGYVSAVSVMPEASVLTVAINDVTIGATHIRAADGVRTAEFEVPQGLLKPGFNSVRISAQQRHRVDCSVQATYELWTEIDSSLTGLVTPATDFAVTNLADLPALAPDEEGSLPIRAVIPSPATPHEVDRMLRAVELIALAGRFEQPLVDVGPPARGDDGLNLVIATPSQISQGALLSAPPRLAAGPNVLVLPAHDGFRTTIVVTGDDEAELDEALDQIVAARVLAGSASGLRAIKAFPGWRVSGNQRVVLRDLGVRSEEFGGRLFRVGFNLIMPPDFYAADYGKAFVDLAGGYSAGLSAGAEVLVKVNDKDATSLRLTNGEGDLFRDERLPLPLGYLRPGLNRVEIEAHLPTAADRSCDPLATLAAAKRFLFLDSTAIEIPSIARISRMPDLAVAATGGFPYSGARRAKLWLPLPDGDSLGAAASVAAQLALAAGAPLDLHFTMREPNPDAGPVLAVGSAAALDGSLLASAGLDPTQLERAWGLQLNANPSSGGVARTSYERIADRRAALERNSPAACHVARRAAVAAAPGAPDQAPFQSIASDSGLEREWEARMQGDSFWREWLTDLPGAIHEFVTAGALRIAASFGAQGPDGHEDSLVDSDSTLVVGQVLFGETADSLWTFVTAPNSAQLFDATGCLIDPRVWRQLSGRLSALDPATGSVTSAPATVSKMIVTEPLSVSNLRLIAAGWFSLNSGAFVLVALASALALAATTTWFVRNVGRRGL